jgi:hypothetical protein
MPARKGSRRLRSVPSNANELVVEAMRVCFHRNGLNIRELERVKLKHGICIMGLTCLEPAIDGGRGGFYGCREHTAAKKAGLKFERYTRMESAYGQIRAREIKQAQEAAQAEAERVARNEKVAKKVKGRRAA